MSRNKIIRFNNYQGHPIFVDFSNITNVQFLPSNNYINIHIKYNPKEIPSSDFYFTIKSDDMEKYSILVEKVMKARSCGLG